MLVQPFVHYAFKKIFDFLDSTLEVKYLLFLARESAFLGFGGECEADVQ